MRIGIDCRRILDPKHNEAAGVGYYTYYLIKNLLELDKTNQYFLFLYNTRIKLDEFKQNNVHIVYFPGLENLGKIPFFYRHIFVPHILKLYRLDIYHNPAYIIPLFYFGKSVITVHDLAYYKNPSWFPDHQFFNTRILTPFSVYKAKKIIAVSESTKKDLIKYFKVKKEKIEVILEGVDDYCNLTVDESKIEEKFKISSPYFLALGTLEPRKNLVRLIEAFNKFLLDNPGSDFKLVLAGKKGWKYEPIFEAIKDLNLGDKVIWVGYVHLPEKIFLLSHSYALVFPSLYEGFGLPILEAMNMGVSVVTSNVSSIPEIVIDNAVLIEPDDVESIKDGLNKIYRDADLRQKLIERGRGIARHFTWEKSAQKTLQLFESLK
ncbi:MAG: glycosyltransferase family 1 protein [Candidatus Parcubacteria bacterium]|nr:glycosyltransferase family 1 protein [Candidatus Parcubacteria bacterium]